MESRVLLLRSRIDAVRECLSRLLPLASCHTVDFYTGCLWRRFVPEALTTYVDDRTVQDVLEEFWRVSRGESDEKTPLSEFVRETRSHHLRVDSNLCLSVEDVRRAAGTDCEDEVMKEFVSPKKGHEMSRLLWLSRLAGGTHCVELGGGKGYVGEAMWRTAGTRSLTVDCDEAALAGGRRRAAALTKILPKSKKLDLSGHKFVQHFVTEATDLTRLVRTHFPDSVDCRILITGLHTCGDLGPASLRLFASQDVLHALCNVPCCYHLLTERSDSCGAVGFPMSDHLSGFALGRNARMLASQSIDKVVAARSLPSLGLHYRAMLQVIIKKYLPDVPIPEGKLKGIAAKSTNFPDYFHRAIEKLRLVGLSDLTVDNLMQIEREFENRHKSLIVFYLLRLCIAQIIENLILLDRLMFLHECGFGNCYLVRIFDAVTSPRCHAIFARR